MLDCLHGIANPPLSSPKDVLLSYYVCVFHCFSCVQLFAILWTVACQTPLSMEFSRPEYWSGLPSPSPGDNPDPWIEPRSPALEADALSSKPVIAYFINFKKTALIFKSHQIRSDQSLSRVRLFANP